jgi:hypothetical protein
MRRLLHRSSSRTRFTPCLESLEDRRLLSGLLPLGLGNSAPSSLLSPPASLTAAPTALLAPVTTAVQNPGDALLGGLHSSAASTSAAVAGGTGLPLHLNLNVDVLFVHLDNVQLNVDLAPHGSSQPLLELGLGGTVALGSQTDAVTTLASEISVGGSNLASLTVGSSSGTPSLPDLPIVGGQTPGGGGQNVVGSILGDLGGGGAGSLPPTSPGAAQTTPSSGTVPVNIVEPPTQLGANTSANAATLVGGRTSSPTAPVLVAVGQPVVDGGSGGTVDDPTLAAAPANLPDGAVADPVAPPIPQLAGGSREDAPAADLAPEGSGLATRFQPDGVGRLRQAVAGLVDQPPQGGWLTGLLSRFAPYLTALFVAGAAFDLERRRRRAVKAAGAPSLK